MDIFEVHRRIMDDYASYIRSFVSIADDEMRARVEQHLDEGRLWPSLVDYVRGASKAKRLTLYTQNGITTLTKAWLAVPAFTDGDMEVRLCRYADEDHFQQLHGKAYAFTCGKEVVLAMGSANFTSAALRRTATNGNLEVLLCYPPVTTKQVTPKSWFDPNETSVFLRDANQLQTATDNTDESSTPPNNFPFRITESQVPIPTMCGLEIGNGSGAASTG